MFDWSPRSLLCRSCCSADLSFLSQTMLSECSQAPLRDCTSRISFFLSQTVRSFFAQQRPVFMSVFPASSHHRAARAPSGASRRPRGRILPRSCRRPCGFRRMPCQRDCFLLTSKAHAYPHVVLRCPLWLSLWSLAKHLLIAD